MTSHARTTATRNRFSRASVGAIAAAIALLAASRADAWHPSGWSFFAWPYAYDLSQTAWSYMNESDTQWCLDLTTAQWSPWGQQGSPRSGWNYFMLPYVFSSSTGHWYYLNGADTLYSVNLRTGRWTLFGEHESNNSAVVPVAAGNGTTLNNQLTRQIPIQVAQAFAGIEVGPAYACGPANGAFYAVVRAKNTGNSARAFVRLNSILFRNSSGTIVASNSSDYIDGSLGRTPGGTETGTCLWPGETGYWTMIDTDLLVSDVASIQVDSIASSTTANSPAPAIVPLSASYAAATDRFTANIKNVGQGLGILDSNFNKFVLFDNADRPLIWRFFLSASIIPSDRSMDPGEAGSISTTFVDFDGLSSKAHVILSFESASGGAALQAATLAASTIPLPPAKASPDQWAAYADAVRNAREDAKAHTPE